ncbi:MAG: STAS domain-containing protein [bacterium]
MKLSVRKTDTVAILDVSGKLMGGPDADVFKETIRNLLDEGFKNVVVNMSQVPFINSTGLGILISAYTTLRKEDGVLKLANVTERIDSLLMITKLGTIFETYSSEEKAVESFK